MAGISPLPPARKAHRHHVWLTAICILVVAIVGLGVLGAVSGPPKPCHVSCGFTPPPTSPALNSTTTYRSSNLGFRIAYDRQYAGSPTAQSSSSIAWHFALRGGGYFQVKFSGSKSGFSSAGDLMNSLQRSDFPQFSSVYTLPNAEVGFVPGQGEVLQGVWNPMVGSAQAERVAIIAAISNDLAITMECEGPQVNDNGAHPNPARMGVADYFCDQMLNGVTWPGQKPL